MQPSHASPSPRPAPATTLLEQAHAAYASNAFPRAVSLVDDFLAASLPILPHAAQACLHALLLGGACHFQLRNFKACIEYNQRAVALDPCFAESYGNMGNAYKEMGCIAEAIALYMKAISLRPKFADVYNNLASAYLQLGDHAAAVDMYHTSLNLNPGMVDAWSNLGNVHKAHGRLEEARRCYLEAIRLRPTFAFAWGNLAGLMRDCGDLAAALKFYEEALRLNPAFGDGWANYGNALREAGRVTDARVAYERALAVNPNAAPVHGNLASCLYDLGDVRGAIAAYRMATALDPHSPDCLNNLGNAYREVGQLDDSIVCYRTALSMNGAHPHAWNNLGNSLKDKGFVREAVTCYATACRLLPNFAAGHSNLASVLKEQGQIEAAVTHYNEALRIDPDFADAWSNLGNAMKDVGRMDDAIRCYSTAIALKPQFADAYSNLASAYKDSGRVEEAIGAYRKALELKPHFPDSLANMVHSLVLVCDWRNRRQDFEALTHMLSVQIAAILGEDADEGAVLPVAPLAATAEAASRALHTLLPAVQPFHSLVYPMSLRQMQRLAQCYALRVKPHAGVLTTLAFAAPVRAPGARLRIGYVSSDFGNHPLSHLMQSVFGMHSRREFEVHCYSLSGEDGSTWRTKIASEVEHFVDVSRISFVEAAQRIAADGIHILVNLNGYTKGARNEIFALRPAPIQVNYMGFCGSLGADYVQYMVVDQTVVPPPLERFYTEALVHMPHSYFVNDHKQSARDVLDVRARPRRATYGIPEGKFVFANFNQIYKLDPTTFRVWCRILQRVPNSVLWLLRFPPAGEVNIRMAARAFGVPDDRIIFTDVAAKDEHLRRGPLCDLFLDTPVCNAHTTGCDILWGGVPVITLPQEKLASRVAASLLNAVGVPECVVHDLTEYEERAVHLATQPALMAALRARVERARETCPLFDTQRWVRNFERGLRAMWRRHEAGLPPSSIVLNEGDEPTAVRTAPITFIGRMVEDTEAQALISSYAASLMSPKQRVVMAQPLRPPANAAALLAAGVVYPTLAADAVSHAHAAAMMAAAQPRPVPQPSMTAPALAAALGVPGGDPVATARGGPSIAWIPVQTAHGVALTPVMPWRNAYGDPAAAYVMAPAHVAQSGLPMSVIDAHALMAQPSVTPMLHAPTVGAAGAVTALGAMPSHPALAGIGLLSAAAAGLPMSQAHLQPYMLQALASASASHAAAPDAASAPRPPIPLAVHELPLHASRQATLREQFDALELAAASAASSGVQYNLISLLSAPRAATPHQPRRALQSHSSPMFFPTSPAWKFMLQQPGEHAHDDDAMMLSPRVASASVLTAQPPVMSPSAEPRAVSLAQHADAVQPLPPRITRRFAPPVLASMLQLSQAPAPVPRVP